MSPDHTLTALGISAILGALAALTLLYAAAYLTVCHAIEARRRLRRSPEDPYAEEHQAAPADEAEQACHDPATTQAQAWLDALNELDDACCERWWTSLATDHDPTCPHQTRKEPR